VGRTVCPSAFRLLVMSDWSPWFRLTIAVLATWRMVRLIAHEDGPFDIIVRLRARAGALGTLMDCPYCLSLWIAAPFAFSLGRTVLECFAAWLAISGGASLIEHLTERSDDPPNVGTSSRG
jgi:hypothetical protein